MKLLIQLFMKVGLAGYFAKQLHRPNGFFGSRLIGAMMNRGNKHLEETAFTYATISSSDHIVEIGFGNGKMLKQLCSKADSGMVHGVDISEDLIKQVSTKLQNQIKTGKLKLHLASISKLPLPDNSIDCIITCNTLYFWPDPLADAKELLRVLKPNGQLICGYRTVDEMQNFEFVTQNPEVFQNQFTDNEVKQLLLNAGFTNVEITVEPSDLAPSHVAKAVK